jgi:hypothetical protein
MFDHAHMGIHNNTGQRAHTAKCVDVHSGTDGGALLDEGHAG